MNKWIIIALAIILVFLFTGGVGATRVEKILWCHTEPNGNSQTLELPLAALTNAGHVDANGNPLHAGDYAGECVTPTPTVTPVVEPTTTPTATPVVMPEATPTTVVTPTATPKPEITATPELQKNTQSDGRTDGRTDGKSDGGKSSDFETIVELPPCTPTTCVWK